MLSQSVCVIIPFYNAEPTLQKCVESVLNQTHREIEVILVNDGSRDGSADIAREFARRDRRVRLVEKDNTGVSDSRNQALRLSSADWITFVDADDHLDRLFIEALVRLAQQYDADVVAGGITLWDQWGARVVTHSVARVFSGPQEISQLCTAVLTGRWSECRAINAETLGYVIGKLYRTSCCRSHSFPVDVPIREDALFNVDVFHDSDRVAVTSHAYYGYVAGPNSATARHRPDFDMEVRRYLGHCRAVVDRCGLSGDIYTASVVAAYAMWVKLRVLHPDNGLSFVRRRCLIQASQRDPMWRQGMRAETAISLPAKHRLLRAAYTRASATFLLVLLTCARRVGVMR